MRSRPIHFDAGSEGQKKPPKMNRHQKRAEAAKLRKEAKRLRKRLEARAKRRFEAMQNEQPEDLEEVAEQYSFG